MRSHTGKKATLAVQHNVRFGLLIRPVESDASHTANEPQRNFNEAGVLLISQHPTAEP